MNCPRPPRKPNARLDLELPSPGVFKHKTTFLAIKMPLEKLLKYISSQTDKSAPSIKLQDNNAASSLGLSRDRRTSNLPWKWWSMGAK